MKLQITDSPAIQLHPDIANPLRALYPAKSVYKITTDIDPPLYRAILEYAGGNLSQAAYLSETIYLADCAAHDTLETGIIHLFKRFEAQYFPKDKAKQSCLVTIIDDMVRPKNEQVWREAETLLALFNNSTIHYPEIQGTYERLEALRGQQQPKSLTTYGDMVLLPPKATYCVIGDSHGDAITVQQIIAEIFRQTGEARPYIIFLGDYVNNGLGSVENLTTILKLQAAYPDQVVLLSGNHDFGETYYTALNETFNKHWRSATKNPYRDKLPPYHYSHGRLDFIRKFGAVYGERLYRAFDRWGKRLPYICLDSSGLMMSHSIGKAKYLCEVDRPIGLPDLVQAKTADLAAMQQLGAAAWSNERSSQHAAMVNTRDITKNLLQEYQALGTTHFIVGHTHYRSGDIRLDDATILTLCASHPQSPEAGHYMYQELTINRQQQRTAEQLPPGDAYPCYAAVTTTANGTPQMKVQPIRP